MKIGWNTRQLEAAVLEFHDKTMDPQANCISWSAAKIQLDLQQRNEKTELKRDWKDWNSEKISGRAKGKEKKS